jgi:hypothetical protein
VTGGEVLPDYTTAIQIAPVVPEYYTAVKFLLRVTADVQHFGPVDWPSSNCPDRVASGGAFGEKRRLVPKSHLQPATKAPAAIVRLRAVVIDKDAAEAAIAEECAAEFSDLSRCLHPTG